MSTTNRGRGGRPSGDLQRVTLRMDESNVEQLEALVDAGEYQNRSDAIRAGVRELLDDHDDDESEDGDRE
jgi:Arc/MetJ-type ribon-helix-helix transcriptional regulator